MSKAKHTAGPWPYEGGNDAGVDIVLPNNTTITVDRACRYTGKYVISRDEMEANARLISEAPSMYDLLREYAETMWVYTPKQKQFNNKVLELIKKIEG